MQKSNTLIYINSQGRNTRTGRLSPSQFRFFKPMTQKERGRWLNKLYNLDNIAYTSIYDENFVDPCSQYEDYSHATVVDIIQVIHEALKELYAEI